MNTALDLPIPSIVVHLMKFTTGDIGNHLNKELTISNYYFIFNVSHVKNLEN
jgi:hypothetical protein